jgi:hypothetical protein
MGLVGGEKECGQAKMNPKFQVFTPAPAGKGAAAAQVSGRMRGAAESFRNTGGSPRGRNEPHARRVRSRDRGSYRFVPAGTAWDRLGPDKFFSPQGILGKGFTAKTPRRQGGETNFTEGNEGPSGRAPTGRRRVGRSPTPTGGSPAPPTAMREREARSAFAWTLRRDKEGNHSQDAKSPRGRDEFHRRKRKTCRSGTSRTREGRRDAGATQEILRNYLDFSWVRKKWEKYA